MISEFDIESGAGAYKLAEMLWPVNRSITGDGIRQSLAIIKEHVPDMVICNLPSGTECFDWIVPNEWNIRDAFIIAPDGKKIVDFKANNLHVVGYSEPIDTYIELEELQQHLYSLPDQSDAVPYVTSYYEKRWGFCLSHQMRETLQNGKYHVFIDSTLKEGNLTYGELLIPGISEDEIFLSTYICHPSMANNELSGPVVTTFIAKWLNTLRERKYTYRIVFVPETIGSIAYLYKKHQHLKKSVKAGFIVTCIGDERTYSYLPSRDGNTLSDIAALHVLKFFDKSFNKYSYLDRGSDERQYCSPGIDLPMATIMRSKYGTYPEYHTSLDDLDLVTPMGLAGGFAALRRTIETIEFNRTPRSTVMCEPQLGKRGLYSTLGTKAPNLNARTILHLMAYSDATKTLLEIAELLNVPAWELSEVCTELEKHGLIEIV